MHRGVVIKVNPGSVVPTDYLALAVKAFPSCMGMAVVAKHEGKNVLVVEHAMEAPTVDKLNDVQTQFKDCNRLIFLGNFPQGALEDDIPPFRVIAKDDDDLIVVLTDGEFVSFDKPNSNHSADYHLMETAVGPMIAKMYNKDAGANLGKFSEEMNAPLTETLMNNFSANRGNIYVLTAEDKLHAYCKGELRKAFPWGTTTQHLGFGETPIVVDNKTATGTTEVPGTKLNKPRLFGAGPKSSDVPKLPTEMPKTDTRPADSPLGDDIKKKEQEEIEKNDEHAWGAPPDKVRKNEGMTKAWYRSDSFSGKCPNNWKDFPRVRLKITKAEAAKQSTTTKDLKELPKVVEAAANRPGVESMPIIGADETKKLHEWLAQGKPKAYREKSGGKQPDAAAIQAMEKDVIPFHKAAGIPLEEVKGWDYGMLVELGNKVGIVALASCCHERGLMNLLHEATAPAKVNPETKVVDIVGTTPAATAQPGRKKLFG